MARIWKVWTNISLVLRIAVGLVIGAILGLTVPQASGITILGDVFVGALKSVAPILVFFLVMSALCTAKHRKKGGSVIRTVVVLYLISTVLASILAVFASMVFPVKMILIESASEITQTAPKDVAEVLKNIITSIFSNPFGAMISGNYICILTWSVLFGLALRAASDTCKTVLNDIATGISTVVTWIINLAPIGIIGLVYAAVSASGFEIFAKYGMLLLLLVGCMLFITLVTNPIMTLICTHKNPYPLVFKCLRESAITAFFTRSSVANIPVNMRACEKFGLNRDNYAVTIPLGATINMDGAAITITVMTMATVATLGIHVDIPTAILLSIVAALASCGASGIAGGSLLLIPTACSLFGIGHDISMQVVAVGFIIGVIQDSIETALNSASDLLLSASAEYRQWRLEGREIHF